MQRHNGFTLIELMITIAIIAILTGIAVPSYTSYIIRGKLQEAHSNLLAMRTKMELFFQDNRSYKPGGAIADPCTAGSTVAVPALKYFDISCPGLTATTYTIQAAGKTGTDLDGAVLTIDQANRRKTVSVPAGWTLPGTDCWVTKKGGQC